MLGNGMPRIQGDVGETRLLNAEQCLDRCKTVMGQHRHAVICTQSKTRTKRVGQSVGLGVHLMKVRC